MMSLRYRGHKNILEVAKNIDAFPKIPEKYKESSQIGGTLSLFSRFLIIILIYNEVSYYHESKLTFKFQPDIDLDVKVKMNVDLVVAMPCAGLSGVDLVDETRQEVFSYGTLKRESTWWELTNEQKLVFDDMKHTNHFLREEYHSVAELIFKDIFHRDISLYDKVPKRKKILTKPYDACRLHGSFVINKVAGILHIVSGDTPYFGGFSDNNHWHSNDFRKIPYNFTHRIYTFSFGDLSSQLIQPLEGDERLVSKESTVVQYFIQIVPTEIKNLFSSINTYQYSVKENFRPIDSKKNSYGMPGIYFKYDWSGIKVIVKQDRDNLTRFLIRLTSIISGIVVISSFLNAIIQQLHDEFIKFLSPQMYDKYKKLIIDPEDPIGVIDDDHHHINMNNGNRSSLTSTSNVTTMTTTQLFTNDLIINANKMNINNPVSIKTVS